MEARARIRAVRPEELEKLTNFARDTFIATFAAQNEPENLKAYTNSAFTLDRITAEYETDGSVFYVAELDAAWLGYLKLNRGEAQTESALSDAMEIERIYLHESVQGQGLGQQFFDFSLARARAETCKWLWLGVWEHNQRAIRFYERQGMRIYDKHDFMMGNEPQTDFMMRMAVA